MSITINKLSDSTFRHIRSTSDGCTSNNTYFPRETFAFNFYIKNKPNVIKTVCFPACCGIGITTIGKIDKTVDLNDVLQKIMNTSGYKALFIKNDSYIIKDIVKNIKAKYIKSLNVYSVCRN